MWEAFILHCLLNIEVGPVQDNNNRRRSGTALRKIAAADSTPANLRRMALFTPLVTLKVRLTAYVSFISGISLLWGSSASGVAGV